MGLVNLTHSILQVASLQMEVEDSKQKYAQAVSNQRNREQPAGHPPLDQHKNRPLDFRSIRFFAAACGKHLEKTMILPRKSESEA